MTERSLRALTPQEAAGAIDNLAQIQQRVIELLIQHTRAMPSFAPLLVALDLERRHLAQLRAALALSS